MRCDKFFILEKFYIQIFLILTCISDVEVACQPSKLDSRVQFPAGANEIGPNEIAPNEIAPNEIAPNEIILSIS
tara:strand:- start:61 stop:282 length:222 start_codon:yes stop_codon:yes gene_type:complete